MDNEKVSINLDDLLEEDQKKTETIKASVHDDEKKKSTVITPSDVSANTNMSKAVNATDIKPARPKVNPEKEFVKKEMQLIDDNIDRVKEDMLKNVINPMKEKCKDIADKKAMEEDGIVDVDNASERDNTNTKLVKEYNPADATNVDWNDDDFLDDDSDSEITDDSLDDEDVASDEEKKKAEEAREKEAEQFKIIKDTIEKDENSFDISSFSIGDKSISMNKTLEIVKEHTKTIVEASFPLFATGRKITFSALTGSELAMMASDMLYGEGNKDSVKRALQTMYKHDVSLDKPNSFTGWLRSIDFRDLVHIYFGLYKATFSGSNFISFDCKQCGTFFMTKDIPIENMYEINKDVLPEYKKRLEDIIANDKIEDDLLHRGKLYKVSNDYAVQLRPRSLYNIIEDSYVSEEFQKKYGPIIALSASISKVFYINREKKSLIPIDMKVDVTSIIKTLKNRILVIHKLVDSITPDEFSLLANAIDDISKISVASEKIYDYFIPEQKCLGTYKKGEFKGQKCTHVFAKQPMNPLNMLFTRHQLVARSI